MNKHIPPNLDLKEIQGQVEEPILEGVWTM